MPVRPLPARRSRLLPVAASIAAILLAVGPVHAVWQPIDTFVTDLGEPSGHLVVSELITGGAGASDEFVELFNPAAEALPLEGLEVVYVTASGATVTRKAAWSVGAPSVPPGAHVLIANEAGVYASVADATYASGLATTGGSIALRIQGAGTAIDAIGWGSATSTWLEGSVAPAPAAGTSLERLPGGVDGSFQDTGDNVVDFVVRDVPDPQNSASAPIGGAPSPTATPSATATSVPPTPGPTPPPSTATPSASASPTPTSAPPSPTPSPLPATPTASASPTPTPAIWIADARALADGTTVTVRGVTLSESTFTDGGGYLADATGGIAILLSDGIFARGREVEVNGVLDTRYEQRTLRAAGANVTDLGSGSEPDPLDVSTAAVGESVEANLVRIEGEVVSSATSLSSGVAFDVDDGSGPIRVLLMPSTGIDTAAWQRGAMVSVIGVVGQRDATGSGTSGYRLQPRELADVHLVPAPSPTPTPVSTPTPTPTATVTPRPTVTPAPSDTPGIVLVSIAQARSAPTGATVRVRGVVTVGSGLVDPITAVVQDASGAIVLRLGDEVGTLQRGVLVDVVGKRSTKSGMLTIRVTDAPTQLGTQPDPDAVRGVSGSLGEDLEAQLVVTRGALTAKPRRSTAGSVSFAVDDGSGELRVAVYPASNIDLDHASAGTWVEVRGALGQDTTGSQPLRGYRIWPRAQDDVTILAGATAGSGPGSGGSSDPSPAGRSRGVDPGTVRLTNLDRSQAPVERGVGARDRSAAGPSPALTHADAPSGALAPLADLARPETPPTLGNRLGLLAVLGLGLSSLAALAFLAWRNGALARLLALVRAPGEVGETPTVPEGSQDVAAIVDVTQPLPRLSVIRVPHEPGGR